MERKIRSYNMLKNSFQLQFLFYDTWIIIYYKYITRRCKTKSYSDQNFPLQKAIIKIRFL